MEIKKLVFKARKVELKWLSDSSDPESDANDVRTLESVVRPHSDLMKAVSNLIPELLKLCNLSKGVYDITSIDVKYNDGGRSFKVIMTSLVDNAGVVRFTLPYLEIKDRFVALFGALESECAKFESREKTQLDMFQNKEAA